MQELQEINARLSRIEKALGIRTPKTLAIGEHWTLTRLDLPYLRMVTYHQMDGYLMVCWASTNVVHPRFSAIEPATVVRLEQADGFADAKALLDTGFRPDTTHGYLDLQQCISEAEVPWPADPIVPGPGYPEPEEVDAGMAAIVETLEPEVSVTPEPEPINLEHLLAGINDLYQHLDDPIALRYELDALVEEVRQCQIDSQNHVLFSSPARETVAPESPRPYTSGLTEKQRAKLESLQSQPNQEPKLAAPTQTRVAKSAKSAKSPKTQAAAIVEGFKIRHHEPQVRAVLVSEPGTRVTNGTKTGTIKETGDRGIKVLWDGGLRAKWLSATQLTVI